MLKGVFYSVFSLPAFFYYFFKSKINFLVPKAKGVSSYPFLRSFDIFFIEINNEKYTYVPTKCYRRNQIESIGEANMFEHLASKTPHRYHGNAFLLKWKTAVLLL